MGNKRQNRKKANFMIQGGALSVAGLFAGSVMLLKQLPLTGIIGDLGNGVYGAAYETFLLFWILTSCALPVVLSSFLSSRYRQEQYRNAGQVWKAAFFWAVFSGSFLGLILFFGADFFAAQVLFEPLAAIPLKILAPCVLLFSLNGAFRGYFQGSGTYMPTAASLVLEQIIFLSVCFPAALLLRDYGEKTGALLRNPGFGPAFGVAGSFLGIFAGSFVAFLFLLFLYSASKSHAKSLELKDATRNREGTKRLLGLLLSAMAPLVLCTLLYRGNLLAEQIMFRFLMSEGGMRTRAGTDWGVFYGKYKVFTMIFVLYALAMGSTLPSSIRSLQKKEAYGQIRERIFLIVKGTLLFVLPGAAFLGALSGCLTEAIYGVQVNVSVSGILAIGSLAAIFYPLCVLFVRTLFGLKRIRQVLFNGMLAFFLHLAALYVMLEELKLGLYGLVYADVLFAFLLCVLNAFSIRRCLKWNPLSIKRLWSCLLAALVSGGILFLLQKAILGALGGGMTLVLCLACGVILYHVLLFLFRGVTELELVHVPFGKFLIRIGKTVGML